MSDASDGPTPTLNTDIFCSLSQPDLQALSQRCRWRTYEPDEIIMHPGDVTQQVAFLQSGTVRVLLCNAAGRQLIFRDCEAGSVLGDMAAIDREPHSAEIVALTKCQVATLSARQFRETLIHHPQVALEELERLSRIVRDLTERHLQMATLPMKFRLASYLLRLAEQQGVEEHVQLPTHQDIASLIGSHREAVTRGLRELRAHGAIAEDADGLRIQPKSLRQILAG